MCAAGLPIPVYQCSSLPTSLSADSEGAAAVRCPYCPALLGGEEGLQEHCTSQHFSPGGTAFSCSLCPLLCPSQQQLQDHYLACHVEALVEQAGRGATVGGGGEEEVAEEEEEAFISDSAVRNLFTGLDRLLAPTEAVLCILFLVVCTHVATSLMSSL